MKIEKARDIQRIRQTIEGLLDNLKDAQKENDEAGIFTIACNIALMGNELARLAGDK